MKSAYVLNGIGLYTLVYKELNRILRIWSQTLLPPAITTTLYFIIFGGLIGPRIGTIEGVHYIQYIVPGLIMMSVITSAYANVSASFYSLKFQNSIDEMLVSPLPNWILVIGFLAGGVVRSLLVAVIVTGIALLFTHLEIQHFFLMGLVVLFAAIFFSMAGLINGLFAKSFDDIMLVPTFILTPLTYLGGVFYSIKMLPPIWQVISLFNPIVYLVNAFRYSILGITDIPVNVAVMLLILLTGLCYLFCLHLMKIGYGIRH